MTNDTLVSNLVGPVEGSPTGDAIIVGNCAVMCHIRFQLHHRLAIPAHGRTVSALETCGGWGRVAFLLPLSPETLNSSVRTWLLVPSDVRIRKGCSVSLSWKSVPLITQTDGVSDKALKLGFCSGKNGHHRI